MDKKDLAGFHIWFDRYVKAFYSDDADMQVNIELKENHTKKVCENMLALGRHLGLREDGLLLAETVALFHDVGRFEQYRRYRTFSDIRSESHGTMGVEILSEHGVLSCLDERERSLVLKAVEYHNILELPADEAEEVLFYSKMIRDADKLDAYDIVVGYYEGKEQRRNQVFEELPDQEGYTPGVVGSLLRGEKVSHKDARTLNDKKMIFAAWIFDVNYGFTLEKVKEKGYIDRIFGLLPRTGDIMRAHRHINGYIEKRLKETPSS